MWWVLGLLACGPKEMRPEGPVMGQEARDAYLGSASPAVYSGASTAEVLVIPTLPWGAHYDLDLVLVSTHPSWNMHEYAQVSTPSGPIWIAKDAREPIREQSIVADIDDIHDFMPELPVPRRSGPVVVDDRSTDKRVDLTLSYTNLDGEPVVVDYRGPRPHTRVKKRNGSTMGHSKQVALATLDLPKRDLAGRARMQINGQQVPLERLAGVVPFAMALEQTQGGLASGSFVTQAVGDGFTTLVVGEDGPRALSWQPNATGWFTESEVRTLGVEVRGGSREITALTATAWDGEQPMVRVVFEPALPDLTRAFTGEVTGRFVIDTNGQQAHAVGRYVASSTGQEGRLALRPEAPWWVTDRAMDIVTVVQGPTTVTTRAVMVGEAP